METHSRRQRGPYVLDRIRNGSLSERDAGTGTNARGDEGHEVVVEARRREARRRKSGIDQTQIDGRMKKAKQEKVDMSKLKMEERRGVKKRR